MDQRLTINEKEFIEAALLLDLRVDGRRPFDYRRITIQFGSKDGSSEVQLGQTHVMGYATAQLVQPYRDRPNEGSLSIFTEFSPMADPNFEAGRPGESAIELGRVIDRGLRESRAVDMESLCIVAGKAVWAIRVDLHIIDNAGNLIDAANIAALASLLTFRRPECTLGGENNQDVIVHDPEIREPLPLTIHHLPVAVTFAFFGEGNIMVTDPTYKEEAVMGGRMTTTLNSNGDICAVQKAGGVGVMPSVVMQCLRIASVKASDITSKIKNAVDERAVLKHFDWPELKADAMREAAFGYRELKKLVSEALTFRDDRRQPCSSALKKMQAYLEKLEHGVYNLARVREGAMKKYKGFGIPWEWMLETGFVCQTVACFPFMDGVLEIRTTELVLEDDVLIQRAITAFGDLTVPVCSEQSV